MLTNRVGRRSGKAAVVRFGVHNGRIRRHEPEQVAHSRHRCIKNRRVVMSADDHINPGTDAWIEPCRVADDHAKDHVALDQMPDDPSADSSSGCGDEDLFSLLCSWELFHKTKSHPPSKMSFTHTPAGIGRGAGGFRSAPAV